MLHYELPRCGVCGKPINALSGYTWFVAPCVSEPLPLWICTPTCLRSSGHEHDIQFGSTARASRPESLAWTFEPGPCDAALDVAIVDCFVAEALCTVSASSPPEHLVSIWDVNTHATEKYPWTRREGGLVLEFDDVVEDKPLHGYVAPKAVDVQRIIDFASTLSGRVRVAVHCAAGIRRSSASVLTLFATRLGPGKEREAVQAMLHARFRTEERGWRNGGIEPNRGVVKLADQLLGRNGALIAAVEAIPKPEWQEK